MEVSSFVSPIPRAFIDSDRTKMSQDFLFVADNRDYSKLSITELIEGITEDV